jgi:hypothetical protein
MSVQATQQQVKEVLTSLLLARGLDDEHDVAKLVSRSQKLARDSGGVLLPRPRRGKGCVALCPASLNQPAHGH